MGGEDVWGVDDGLGLGLKEECCVRGGEHRLGVEWKVELGGEGGPSKTGE